MITEITSCRGSDPYIFKNTLKRTPNSILHLSGQIFCAGSEMPYAEEKVHSWHVQSNKSWWLLCWKKYLTGSFKSPSTIPFLAHFCFRNIGLCPPSPLAARGGSRESHNEDSLVGLPFSCSPLSKTPLWTHRWTGSLDVLIASLHHFLSWSSASVSLYAFLKRYSLCLAPHEGGAGGCAGWGTAWQWSHPQP